MAIKGLRSRSPVILSDTQLALLTFLAALSVRLIHIGERSLWLDEAYSVWLSAQSLAVIRETVDFHPPLYYVLLKLWTSAGSWAASDTGVRLPSAIFSAASIAGGVWCVRRLRLPGAGLVAVLGVTSALSVWYAHEVRMYAAASLAILAASACMALLTWQTPPRATAISLWTAYAVAAVASIYLSYDAILVLFGINALCLGAMLLKRPPGWILTRTLGGWLLAHALVVDAYLPQMRNLSITLRDATSLHWAARFPIVATAALAGALGMALFVFAFWRLPRLRGPVIIVIALTALLLLGAASLVPQGLSIKRHVAIIAPLLMVACGVALAAAGAARHWRVLAVAAGIPALIAVLFVHPKEDWRGVAALLRQEARPGDALVLHRGYIDFPLQRYFPLERWVVVKAGRSDDVAEITHSATARVWLIESHTGNPDTLAPNVASGRVLALDRSFYRVAVRRFDRS